MPDDDRHTRDRVRTLDPVGDTLWKRAREGRESDTPPEQLALPEEDVLPRAQKAFDQVLKKLGKPDLEEAADQAKVLAQTLKDEGPESLDLCAGHRSSGMQALLGQAVSIVLASEDPDVLISAGEDELAALIGEQFARGVIRRYALDRAVPFLEDDAPDVMDALDFLELADLTFTTSILRALIKDLLT